MSNARSLVGGAWRAAVPEWEEPRHHGPIKVSTQYPTSAHVATHLPTFSVRRGLVACVGRPDAAPGAGLGMCAVVGRLPRVGGVLAAIRRPARAIAPIGGDWAALCGIGAAPCGGGAALSSRAARRRRSSADRQAASVEERRGKRGGY